MKEVIIEVRSGCASVAQQAKGTRVIIRDYDHGCGDQQNADGEWYEQSDFETPEEP